jgi:AraC-like DNA-binding protein
MDKIVFSTEQLPAELDNRARYALWHDLYESTYTALDLAPLPDRPFTADFEFAQLGAIGLGHFEATLGHMGRSPRQIAKHPRDNLCLALVGPDCSIIHRQLGREVAHAPGSIVLTSEGDPAMIDIPNGSSWYLLNIPRKALTSRVGNAVDLVATSLRPDAEIAAHLRRYAAMLLNGDSSPNHPALAAQIGDTLLDLATLALGSAGEPIEIARANGLRAARRDAILAEIKASFARPDFSPHHVAMKLGLSPRYIQLLLQDSGSSFTERVLEARLHKARKMLADPRNHTRNMADIALASGFNDVSYFNRCFRRQFGAAPSALRMQARQVH